MKIPNGRVSGLSQAIAIATLAGCAGLPPELATTRVSNAHAPPATHADSCRDLLAANSHSAASVLDSADIRLFSWNMQKARHTRSHDDLDSMASDRDLVLLQEAVAGRGFPASNHKARFSSFAPGYQVGNAMTGVLTMSASMPLAHCNLTSWEPWLGTPKATSVTEYALSEPDTTLVVVNIHAINFTFGVERFREQMEQIASALQDHAGPIILSGDFNTWRRKRLEIVTQLSRRLGLRAAVFADDRRKVVFGNALDHVYFRGLHQKTASTQGVVTSDHNPLMVTLSR